MGRRAERSAEPTSAAVRSAGDPRRAAVSPDARFSAYQAMAQTSPRAAQLRSLQAIADGYAARQRSPRPGPVVQRYVDHDGFSLSEGGTFAVVREGRPDSELYVADGVALPAFQHIVLARNGVV